MMFYMQVPLLDMIFFHFDDINEDFLKILAGVYSCVALRRVRVL